MTIYVLFQGDFDDRKVVGVFSNRALAEQADKQVERNPYWAEPDIEVFELDQTAAEREAEEARLKQAMAEAYEKVLKPLPWREYGLYNHAVDVRLKEK